MHCVTLVFLAIVLVCVSARLVNHPAREDKKPLEVGYNEAGVKGNVISCAKTAVQKLIACFKKMSKNDVLYSRANEVPADEPTEGQELGEGEGLNVPIACITAVLLEFATYVKA